MTIGGGRPLQAFLCKLCKPSSASRPIKPARPADRLRRANAIDFVGPAHLKGAAWRGRSSVGRALQSHCRGQGFESPRLHQPATCLSRPGSQIGLGPDGPHVSGTRPSPPSNIDRPAGHVCGDRDRAHERPRARPGPHRSARFHGRARKGARRSKTQGCSTTGLKHRRLGARPGTAGHAENGLPEGNRTPDPRFRKPVLYPAELPGGGTLVVRVSSLRRHARRRCSSYDAIGPR